MRTETPAASISRLVQGAVVPALLAVVIAAAAVIQPLAALAMAGGVCFLAAYLYRRDWLVAAIFLLLLLQNLAYSRLLPANERLALAVKHADDLLLVFFAVALTIEAFFPTVRWRSIPQWRPFALLVFLCLLSAVFNRLDLRTTAVGTYVLLKNFIWFFLVASIRLDDRGYERVFRFLVGVLGAILAFGFVQWVTGDLTYRLLGLPQDYRFGILRLRSIFIEPVYMAETMALLAVLALSAHVHIPRPGYLALAAAAAVAVVLTMLVKTILALGLVVGFLLLRKRPWLFVAYAAVAAVAMVSFAEYGVKNIQSQYDVYIASPQSVRREGYRICGEILRDSPFLGVGPGRFGGFAATLLDSPIPERYDFLNYDQLDYSTIDSHWPHLAAEIGLLGLLVYGWFFWAAARSAWRLAKRQDASPFRRILAMTAVVFLLVAIAEGFAAANFEDTLTGFLIFPLLGLTQGATAPREC